MPCYLAAVHFLECNHAYQFKMGCTFPPCHESFSNVCSLPNRKFLTVVSYVWSCPRCYDLEWSISVEKLNRASELRLQALAEYTDAHNNFQTAQGLQDAINRRRNWEYERLAEQREQQQEEKEFAATFAEDYGRARYLSLYGERMEIRLLGMEEALALRANIIRWPNIALIKDTRAWARSVVSNNGPTLRYAKRQRMYENGTLPLPRELPRYPSDFRPQIKTSSTTPSLTHSPVTDTSRSVSPPKSHVPEHHPTTSIENKPVNGAKQYIDPSLRIPFSDEDEPDLSDSWTW